MAIRLVIDTDCAFAKLSKESAQHVGKTNRIANAAIEILRLPEPGIRMAGKSVGQRVEGKVVIQFVGPVTLHVEDTEAENRQELNPEDRIVQTHSLSKAKRTSKRPILRKKAKAKGDGKPPRSLQRASKRR